MSVASILAGSARASLIAPAGTGKTQVVVEAAGSFRERCQLILTHTHAGVDALRRRLRELKIASERYQVDTIAGWCLRFVRSYPSTSGVRVETPRGEMWDEVYAGAARFFSRPFAREILTASYAGCFVDEYQDCTVQQHAVVLAIAHVLPTRLLGDPLQGIFGFGSTQLVDWGQAVQPSFPAISGLSIPWRWRTTNPSLGSFVVSARAQLIAGASLDLSHPAVRIVPENGRPLQSTISLCHRLADAQSGRVVVLRRDPWQCAQLSRSLGGRYSVVEAIDCKDLYEAAENFSTLRGADLAAALVATASKCLTSIGTEMEPLLNLIRKGSRQRRTTRHALQFSSLWAVADSGSIHAVREALTVLRKTAGAVLHRRELFDALMESIDCCEGSCLSGLRDAAWKVRDRDRHRGRSLPMYGVATPLVVKGLEFDHAVVLDIESMNAAQAYVALSRAQKSLWIVAGSSRLAPRPWPPGWSKALQDLLRES